MTEFIEKYDTILVIMLIPALVLLYAVITAFERTASNIALALFYYFMAVVGIGFMVHFYLAERYGMAFMGLYLTGFMLYYGLKVIGEKREE